MKELDLTKHFVFTNGMREVTAKFIEIDNNQTVNKYCFSMDVGDMKATVWTDKYGKIAFFNNIDVPIAYNLQIRNVEENKHKSSDEPIYYDPEEVSKFNARKLDSRGIVKFNKDGHYSIYFLPKK